jgi:hypothetical protein
MRGGPDVEALELCGEDQRLAIRLRKMGELQCEPLGRAVGPVRQQRNPVGSLVQVLVDELRAAARVHAREILDTLVGDETRTRWTLPGVGDRQLEMLVGQFAGAERPEQFPHILEELFVGHCLPLAQQRLGDLRPAAHPARPCARTGRP